MSGLARRSRLLSIRFFINEEEKTIEKTVPLPNHQAGLEEVVALLTDPKQGVIKNPLQIEVVGHRVVHGGEKYTAATLITNEVKEAIQQLFLLAPLHNPANLTGIETAENIFRQAKQVAVFDTAFYQTMPEPAFRYALPKKLYTNDKIRAYGFHGTSHQYVSQQAIRYLQNPSSKIISIHLGNGCSITAVKDGKSIDTSMGFGPLNGLVMGTRSGDIDPSVIFYLLDNGLSPQEVSALLNKQSGMLGMTGYSDMRDINKAVANGDAEAKLALQLYAYRIQKYIGAYAAAMNGLDAILFTAGVGENDSQMRNAVCTGLDFLGISINEERNTIRSGEIREINEMGAAVKVLIVPTNEEMEIANQCYALLGASA